MQQPSSSGLSSSGSATPHRCNSSEQWRKVLPSEGGPPDSPAGCTSPEPCWLLRLCVSIIILPREDSCSDSDANFPSFSSVYEPCPLRLESLQVGMKSECLERTPRCHIQWPVVHHPRPRVALAPCSFSEIQAETFAGAAYLSCCDCESSNFLIPCLCPQHNHPIINLGPSLTLFICL